MALDRLRVLLNSILLIKILSLLNVVKVAVLLRTASKFAIFLASGLKDEKLIKKQAYMKTETCKLYSKVFWIFLPNVVKIDPYIFELYRFKVGAFFDTQCNTQLWVCLYTVTQKMHQLVYALGVSGEMRNSCPHVRDCSSQTQLALCLVEEANISTGGFWPYDALVQLNWTACCVCWSSDPDRAWESGQTDKCG